MNELRCVLLRVHLADGLRDAKVQQLHATGSQQHDVGRAHVAVDDVQRLAVGRGQPVRVAEPQRHLMSDVNGDGDGKGPLPFAQRPQHRQQVAATQQLHGQEIAAVDLPEVEYLHHVRVVQQGRDARLVHEHLDEVRGAGAIAEDALHHQIAAEPFGARNHRPEHLRHAARAHPVEQDVTSKPLWCLLRVHGLC